MASFKSGRPIETGGNWPEPETGTPFALYSYSKSDAAFSSHVDAAVEKQRGIASAARPASASSSEQKQGWGGARNRADRVSDSLSLHQAEGIVRAARRACAIGLPFNRHVTIHLERAGVPDAEAAVAIGAYLTLARDFLRKRGWVLA
ncbi:MAG: hypothetical protein HKN78_09860, partial [Sphingomonadaceae bacterium]|nr:hypothetical protein [Sphingomonadaceae bacterium]